MDQRSAGGTDSCPGKHGQAAMTAKLRTPMQHMAGFNCVWNNRTSVSCRILHRIWENIAGLLPLLQDGPHQTV